MKYLVYLLLGLNVVYAVWYQAQPPRMPQASTVAPVLADVEPLVLLSERNRGKPATSGPSVTPVETAEGTVTAPGPVSSPTTESTKAPAVVDVLPACRTIGPIAGRGEASELRGELSQQGYPATLREGEIQAPSGYQVYLPAMSPEKVDEVVRDLEAAGMTDYFVGRHNRISLGIFSDKDKARVRQHSVSQLGYDAMLDVRYKTRKVYWIDIEESGRALASSEAWQQIVAHYPKIQAQQVSCE